MAALSENVLTVSMFLSVVFLPGVLADCPNPVLIAATPGEMEALNGSCLQIPCSYSTTDSTYNNNKVIYGIWLKANPYFKENPSSLIFNSSGSVSIYPLNMTGNLREKNCTTVFDDLKTSYTDTYYLRIENWPFMATDICCPLHIKVKDSPWSPSINISVGDLKEHQSVTVTCSAFTPCPNSPPELTWNLQQDSLRQTEKNTDGTFTTKIQESITLSDTHDGYNITCSARYPVIGGNKTAETQVILSVSYAPRNTLATISPSGLVSAGSWVKLSCSSRAKPPPRFTWFRNSKHGATNVSMEKIYRFNASEGGEFYCVATNDLGKKTSSVILVLTKGEKLLVPVTVGIIVVICFLVFMVVAIWYFMTKHSVPQKTQSQVDVDAGVQNSAFEKEEELHHGEVRIIKMTPKTALNPVQDNEHQETEYAQVKVSKPEKVSTQAADNPEKYTEEKKN